jgi:hypothetical protein
LLRGFGIVEVALGEPGRTQHDLSGGFAIMRHVVHLGVDDAKIDQRPGHASPGAEIDLSVSVAGEVL